MRTLRRSSKDQLNLFRVPDVQDINKTPSYWDTKGEDELQRFLAGYAGNVHTSMVIMRNTEIGIEVLGPFDDNKKSTFTNISNNNQNNTTKIALFDKPQEPDYLANWISSAIPLSAISVLIFAVILVYGKITAPPKSPPKGELYDSEEDEDAPNPNDKRGNEGDEYEHDLETGIALATRKLDANEIIMRGGLKTLLLHCLLIFEI